MIATALLLAPLAVAYAGYRHRVAWKRRMVRKIIAKAVKLTESHTEARRIAIEHAADLDRLTAWHYPKIAPGFMADCVRLGAAIDDARRLPH